MNATASSATPSAPGVLGSEADYRALLQSIVEVARSIFAAKASSLMLLDEEADELVFEAVAGEGSDTLIGQRFPSSTGIGGWVLVTRQPLVIEDLRQDPRFSRTTAEQTGYVPEGMMCVPLLYDEQALGVLYVLDRPQNSRFTLAEMDLLGLFGNQAAIALSCSGAPAACGRSWRARRATTWPRSRELAQTVDKLEDERRAAGVKLIKAIEEVLR